MNSKNIRSYGVVINGKFNERYTPSSVRIFSQALQKTLEYAEMLLTADAVVTYVDYRGTLCSNVALKQGRYNFLVREIRSVSAGEVYIVHDGQISTSRDE